RPSASALCGGRRRLDLQPHRDRLEGRRTAAGVDGGAAEYVGLGEIGERRAARQVEGRRPPLHAATVGGEGDLLSRGNAEGRHVVAIEEDGVATGAVAVAVALF